MLSLLLRFSPNFYITTKLSTIIQKNVAATNKINFPYFNETSLHFFAMVLWIITNLYLYNIAGQFGLFLHVTSQFKMNLFYLILL